jgi:hypothetical protein
MLVEVE